MYSPTGEHQPQPLLEVRDIKTHFKTPRGLLRAVDGISFDLDRGRTLGIVGESGSGKSVLSRSIMRLLPRRNIATTGSVKFDGTELVGAPEAEMRKTWGPAMSMIFQDPIASLNPVMKVGSQITEGLRHHLGLPRREAKDTAIELLRSVGIPEPARRFGEYPHELSGGMCQRVVIAIALACGPKLLLADEPTTALDVTVQAQILDLLAGLQEDRNMTMILVTHDLGVVAARTDEIAVMYAGKIVEKAPTTTLFSNMKMPYTEALLSSIPSMDNRPHTRLEVIGGSPPDLVKLSSGCNFAPRCLYAQPRCHEEEPQLSLADSTDHSYACWYPVGTPAGNEALERNILG